MIDISKIDYSHLDRPEVLHFLFYPRSEWGQTFENEQFEELMIPVEKDVSIGGRFYQSGKSSANILFFHGNGEIVEDYHDLGILYNESGINFLPVDYRGYGRSSGEPTITAMIRDAHCIFDFVQEWLRKKGFGGPFVVMGRSLGSASALELAANYDDHIKALIIESGFAHTGPLLELLGVETQGAKTGLGNLAKIERFKNPTLIIHAEYDHIIPFSDGQDLFKACSAKEKQLLMIPGANHNDIFARGLPEYMAAIGSLINKLK